MNIDNYDYYAKQFNTPYRSTVLFCEFLKKHQLMQESGSASVLDIGCGMGETLFYMSKRFPRANFLGVDLIQDLISAGSGFFKEEKITNVRLIQSNLFDLNPGNFHGFNGMLSLQTLSWLPDWKNALIKMCSLGCDWIALSSLFFDGSINCEIKIQDHAIPQDEKPFTEYHYNIYSISLIKKMLFENGYELFAHEPFEIDLDIPKPDSGRMGTYTVKTDEGKRLQFSGPLFMSWYFMAARKIKVE